MGAILLGLRLPEHKLREIGATCYNALEDNVSGEAPFAPDCERHYRDVRTGLPAVRPASRRLAGHR
jgi:hypothetical protein